MRSGLVGAANVKEENYFKNRKLWKESGKKDLITAGMGQ